MLPIPTIQSKIAALDTINKKKSIKIYRSHKLPIHIVVIT